uniref:Uncharacterized protein n=1 Tax=Anguilla anguilla TaxID=7936 RepID=A0A0E9SJ19_ANGAN
MFVGVKLNLLPTTFPRLSRNTTALLRLPRCLYPMKYNLLYRIPNFSHSRSPIPIYPMRSIYC